MASTLTPWHKVVELREDLRTGDMALKQFAADLYEVLMRRGQQPIYENVDSFFALTFPAANLRKLAGDVIQRLGGKNDKAVHQLALTYGGGKTHSLIALTHLVRDPDILPNTPSVNEFKAAADMEIPKSLVAALCFDKIDVINGLEVCSPSGDIRRLKYPWSILAWQIAGEKGLAALNIDNPEEERTEPPSEDPLTKLLSFDMRGGMPLLILVDEVLLYANNVVPSKPCWRSYLTNFFQALTQAVSKADRCCLVASILSSRAEDNTSLGATLESELSSIFGRVGEGSIIAITRDDVSEILRRRFFTPASVCDTAAFRPHVLKVLTSIATIDESTRIHGSEKEELYGKCYPFHPELTEIFYAKWNGLKRFQRTRGLLRTFALALRDAAVWDTSPLIGPAVFLPTSKRADLPAATQELVDIADNSMGEERGAWGSILRTELDRAADADKTFSLKNRETEQAVISVFLHSQPIGMDARTTELWPLVSMGKPQRIDLEKALREWANTSFWLDDQMSAGTELPEKWKLGAKPNLNQMHATAKKRISDTDKASRLFNEVRKEKSLTAGIDPEVVRHLLPQSPSDVTDDGKFHYAVLSPDAVCSGLTPSGLAVRFLKEGSNPDTPRIHRNAMVLLAPSRDGLDIAQERVSDVMAWERVKLDLQTQENSGAVDTVRMTTLSTLLNAANGRMTEAIKQAWCIAVTLNEKGDPYAFKLNLGGLPPFSAIKADVRSRVQSSAINAAAILPGGPYNLWSDDDQFRSVRDLVGAFTRLPKLPKMLTLQPVLDTLQAGCRDGIFALRLPRPDGSARTWWKNSPDLQSMRDPELELWLPEYARLLSIVPELLLPGGLPQLWPDEEEKELSVAELLRYFSGENVLTVQREGYEDSLPVPGAHKDVVYQSISKAVEDGNLWLLNPPSSVLNEPIPTGVLNENAILRTPPEPLNGFSITPENLPSAWGEHKSISVSAIMAALSREKNVTLPWKTIKDVVNAAIASRCLEVDPAFGNWSCEYRDAGTVYLRIPQVSTHSSTHDRTVTDEAESHNTLVNFTVSPTQLFDLGDFSAEIQEWQARNGDVPVQFNISVTLGDEASGLSEEARKALIDLFANFHPNL